MSAVERRGVPTVSLTASEFIEDGRWSANVFGLPELPLAEVPLPFTNRDPDTIEAYIESCTDQIIGALTNTQERLSSRPVFEHVTLETAPLLHYDGDDLLDAWERMNAAFLESAWSDGLPLVPPTQEKVAAMVAASGLPADHVVGVFAPGLGIGTVEKIAANAVMAGAKPATMPVILAMMDCVLDPSIGLRTFAMSTGPQAPVVMVSGPIADEIGMNRGICALGPGAVSQVNISIGRTLRLVMMNVGHSYPGVSDMDTIGSSMKFSACVAENEARNPWAPHRVQQGFPSESSTVTVNVPYGVVELFDFQNYDPEKLLDTFASVAASSGASPSDGVWLVKSGADLQMGYPFVSQMHNLILLCPEHAQVFATAGWSIPMIKERLYDKVRLPFRTLMNNKPMQSFRVAHPELLFLLDAPETLVPVFPSPECFDIFVVGADAGRSLYFPGGTVSVTKTVQRR